MNQNRDVPIDVTCRHGHVSGREEDYARSKAERLLRFHDRISRIELVVDGPHEAPQMELIVHLDNAPHSVAKEQGPNFTSTVDRLVDKMERQLVKAKEKRKNHKGRGVRGAPSEAPGGDDDGDDDTGREDRDQ
jgi:putative sigma-54 modulation protein